MSYIQLIRWQQIFRGRSSLLAKVFSFRLESMILFLLCVVRYLFVFSVLLFPGCVLVSCWVVELGVFLCSFYSFFSMSYIFLNFVFFIHYLLYSCLPLHCCFVCLSLYLGFWVSYCPALSSSFLGYCCFFLVFRSVAEWSLSPYSLVNGVISFVFLSIVSCCAVSILSFVIDVSPPSCQVFVLILSRCCVLFIILLSSFSVACLATIVLLSIVSLFYSSSISSLHASFSSFFLLFSPCLFSPHIFSS